MGGVVIDEGIPRLAGREGEALLHQRQQVPSVLPHNWDALLGMRQQQAGGGRHDIVQALVGRLPGLGARQLAPLDDEVEARGQLLVHAIAEGDGEMVDEMGQRLGGVLHDGHPGGRTGIDAAQDPSLRGQEALFDLRQDELHILLGMEMRDVVRSGAQCAQRVHQIGLGHLPAFLVAQRIDAEFQQLLDLLGRESGAASGIGQGGRLVGRG